MKLKKLIRKLIREMIESESKQKACPACGALNDHDATKCSSCGHSGGWFKKNKNKSKNESKVKKIYEQVKDYICPPATQNVSLNTKNRNSTIKNHMYGPLNVKVPEDHWKKIAKKWNTSEKAAKKSLCGNCVAFDISPRMDECMPGKISDDSGRLGYCWMHHFKCHSARTCDTWAMGGPIIKDKVSKDWQDKNSFKEEK
jgi:ribosomal protein L40E